MPTMFSWDGAGVTAAADLFEIAIATAPAEWVLGLFITQSSDVGDAAEEVLRFRHLWGNTTSGSGGSTVSAANAGHLGESSATVEGPNSTPASVGTPDPGFTDGFNIRAGYSMWFPPNMEPVMTPDDGGGEVNVFRLSAAPADSVTLGATIYLTGPSQP